MSERWLPIPGFEEAYEVSDLGRVRSIDRTVKTSKGERCYRGKSLSPGKSGEYGHLTVVLGRSGGSHFVHNLVLRAFVGPPGEDQESRHLNCDGSDNRLVNLCWGSKSENGKDVTRNSRRMFTYEQAEEIRQKRGSGFLLRELAEEYGCSMSLIHQIVTGYRYDPTQ